MELADLVAAVVVLGVGEISIAALGLAPRGVDRARIKGPGPAVQPVHEVVLGREVSPAPQIQPNSRREIHWRRSPMTHLLALRHQHEPRPPVPASASAQDGIEGQHGRMLLRRRVGGRAGVRAWVVEGGVDVVGAVDLGL